MCVLFAAVLLTESCLGERLYVCLSIRILFVVVVEGGFRMFLVVVVVVVL